MGSKHIRPDQKTNALTLRAAGYTITVISDMTGISVSTLKRLFGEYAVERGKLKKEAVHEATEALINDANAIDQIKREIAALIQDDVAHVRRLRQAMAEATDKLVATDTTQAVQVMRAISSGAVALKSTSETLRKSLGIDKNDDLDGDLPELNISIMTDDQIEAIKEKAKAKLRGEIDEFEYGESDDDEVIEYDNDTVMDGEYVAS